MKMHGPVVVELKVHIINPETGRIGVATIELGAGKYPTPEYIAARLAKFADGELEQAAPGFELMDRREFMADMVEERTGVREYFACPAEWDQIEGETDQS